MVLLRYLLTQGIFDTAQKNSVINLDPSGIRTHTPIVRALQGKYGLSSCVASPHGVFFSSWFGVCPDAISSLFLLFLRGSFELWNDPRLLLSVYTSRHNNLRITIYTLSFPTGGRPIAVSKRRTKQLPRANQMSQSFSNVDMLNRTCTWSSNRFSGVWSRGYRRRTSGGEGGCYCIE